MGHALPHDTIPHHVSAFLRKPRDVSLVLPPPLSHTRASHASRGSPPPCWRPSLPHHRPPCAAVRWSLASARQCRPSPPMPPSAQGDPNSPCEQVTRHPLFWWHLVTLSGRGSIRGLRQGLESRLIVGDTCCQLGRGNDVFMAPFPRGPRIELARCNRPHVATYAWQLSQH